VSEEKGVLQGFADEGKTGKKKKDYESKKIHGGKRVE
jgi:hypothetical protein